MVFLSIMVFSLNLVVVTQGPGHTDLNGPTDLVIGVGLEQCQNVKM